MEQPAVIVIVNELCFCIVYLVIVTIVNPLQYKSASIFNTNHLESNVMHGCSLGNSS